MAEGRYRVLAVATHLVQYMAPLFGRMAKDSSLDFQVDYCTLRGAEAGHDAEFGANVKWDVPLLATLAVSAQYAAMQSAMPMRRPGMI